MNIARTEDMQDVSRLQILVGVDVAKLSGVETTEVNQAVSNNPDKFSEGYVFELTKDEKSEVVKNIDHLESLTFSPYLPKAFTPEALANALEPSVSTEQSALGRFVSRNRISEFTKPILDAICNEG